MMKVTTAQGKNYEGDFYAVDPLTKAVTLKGADDTFIVINSASIVSMTGSLTKAPDLSKFGVSLQDMDAQEQAALRASEKSFESINFNVAPEIQQLFDKFSSIFTDCRWHENSMVVLEEYVILPPYTEVVVLPGKEGGGLARIQMILQGERKKLKI